jgi:hypothetical protein
LKKITQFHGYAHCSDLNIQYFWKWTNANPMKIFGQLAMARQSSQVVNWGKTKPRLAGNQIPFGGIRFGLYNSSRIPSIIGSYTKPNLVPPKRIWFPAKGQLISKTNCQAEDSSKKRTNEFVFTSMRRVFVRFLDESSARKKTGSRLSEL